MGKTVGIDGIANEVWRCGGGEINRWVWKFCNRIWRDEGWSETKILPMKEGIIIPIVNKGEGKQWRNIEE